MAVFQDLRKIYKKTHAVIVYRYTRLIDHLQEAGERFKPRRYYD